MKIELDASPDLLKTKFLNIKSRQDISAMLEIDNKILKYCLYILPAPLQYKTFLIKKKNGNHREINSPNNNLKIIQQKLNKILMLIYQPRKSVYGFVADRNIIQNATVHKGQRYVFNIDLENFFPSINFGRVRGLFLSKKFNFNNEVATTLAQICCHRNELPQGAPTSPIISNMICSNLDRELQKLANSYRCYYTRYADDITFSMTDKTFPESIGSIDDVKISHVGDELEEIINHNGFSINHNKIRLQSNKVSQMVTGLVVNKNVNVRRKYTNQLRAIFHAWEKYGEKFAEQEHHTKYYKKHLRTNNPPPLYNIVRGKMEFLKNVRGEDDCVYKKFQSFFAKLDERYMAYMIKEQEKLQYRDFFISHASEDKDEIARPLADKLIEIGCKVWFDEYELKIGDSLFDKISQGLNDSKYGVVILTKSFFDKSWTNTELRGLFSREMQGHKVLLPLWHGINSDDVSRKYPLLADMYAFNTDRMTIDKIANELKKLIK